jgi:hypothetical protein
MKPGRNDPCPCGSGKKYKKCCYLKGQFSFVPDTQDDDDDDDEYYDEDEDEGYKKQELLINGLNNLRRIFLDREPHIKEYYKIRKLHSEIASAMVKYHFDGKFKWQIGDDSISKPKPENIISLASDFDLDTPTGEHCFYDMVMYKAAPNMNCITEDFIRDCRYKKPEKIEFLQSMLDSKPGLFEVTGTDMTKGYACIKDVFSGVEYKIIDIGISGQQNFDFYYFYARIITYHGISFNSGLHMMFKKTDSFIKNHIQEHKKDFHPDGELHRFIQLYNRYSKDPDRIKVVTNYPTR